MKIKTNQIFSNFIQHGLNLERVSKNIISISKSGEIPVEILLPETFEIEKESIRQLIDFAHLEAASGEKIKCACATPDFHKGSSVPVGTVVVSNHNMVIPGAIGTDINCGMRLHHTGLTYEQFLSQKTALISLLKGDLLEGTRDIPTTGISMTELFQNGLGGFWDTMKKNQKGIFAKIDFSKVENELNKMHVSSFVSGDSKYAPENLIKREWLRDPSLATLGGGNHFLEFQVVKEIRNKQKAYEQGLKIGDVVVMIHSGSRDVGFYVGQQWMDKAKDQWPKDKKYPHHKIFAIEGDHAQEYLNAMNSAAHYASANRALLAEIVRQRTLEVFKKENNNLIIDVPHNIIIQEKIGNVHRKGATPAYQDDLLLIPGSMGHDSYLLTGLGNEKWLQSASHGAGRNISRTKMTIKGKLNKNSLGLDGVECITLKEERKIEEAPSAYKEIGEVIRSQVEENVAEVVAIFAPITTFKA